MVTIDFEGHEARAKKIIPHTPEAGDLYSTGTCYEREPVSLEWEVLDPKSQKLPYLAHIKSLSKSWRTLRHLADFMEVGTTPLRWNDLVTNPKERKERTHRTNITLVEYGTAHRPKQTHITTAESLKERLSNLPQSDSPVHRLFIVEDLSRQVIEQLGSRFDVDPLFFREQIDDYTWYNTRDPWASPPALAANLQHCQWFRVRNVRLRYFASDDSFQNARQDSNSFNVLRRPDNDENHWLYLDAPDSIISITRTRSTVWIGKDKSCGNGAVAIVLLDPTVCDGRPLWHDRTNWLCTPSMDSTTSPAFEPSGSLYKDIVQMSAAFPWFESTSAQTSVDTQVFAKPMLFTVCAEWLVVCDYIKARLAQIEWELEKPSLFRSKGDIIDNSLKRLHTWRRVLPTYREMVTETLDQALPAAARLTSPSGSAFADITPDFERVLNTLNELQARVDRLTSIVTAEITIEDSRRGLQENHNLARLTWLATTFIPLSFVTGLFSMQNDISDMKVTFGWYFAAAIPLTAIILFIAWHAGGQKSRKQKAEAPSVSMHERKRK
ncbi:uncharacterized protein N0V89_000092 [Didymosphaeria variabile]|uniref:Cora-domain-containing protein n=1 Tax=Didymosphaeria variabile TaxID=1932322 RepID=A0A9W9CFE7_9PLEO|nr:uncharacterized protein N0V89_000092 [Didymosphaeria variabile]KAJ4359537.1 hypothetical protein N0V89_000092 [Didymosphaeria variabile]